MLAFAVSVFVLGGVVVVLVTALVPLPHFDSISPAQFAGRLAFVDDDNCIFLAELETADLTEIRCESERGWVDDLRWTEEGLEVTTYLNQPTTKVIDPADGTILATKIGDEVSPRSEAGDFVIDSPQRGTVVLNDAELNELLRLTGPERYWIESVSSNDSGLISFVDSHGRLAIFEPPGSVPVLVADSIRSWPAPAWEPMPS